MKIFTILYIFLLSLASFGYLTPTTNTGTVSSVGLVPPSFMSVSDSPIITSGDIGLDWDTQVKNKVLVGPATGSDAAPTFRLLVAADIPTVTAATVSTVVGRDASANSNFGNLGISTTVVNLAGGVHLRSSQTTSPTAAPNANAGTGATCAVTHATDIAGTVTLVTTAVSPSVGAECAVTFNVAFTTVPICVMYPASATTASLEVLSQVFVTTTTSVMTINFGGADAAGHTYVYNYNCIETK